MSDGVINVNVFVFHRKQFLMNLRFFIKEILKEAVAKENIMLKSLKFFEIYKKVENFALKIHS